MTARAERVAEAQRLRAQGLKLREIGERMGAAVSTVGGWLCDPDLSKQNARRDSYRGTCSECGSPMDGSEGYRAQREGRVCMDCRTWSDDELVAAIQLWAARHHGVPPREVELRSPGYPWGRTVASRLGWNNALLAAGFPLHMDRRPETQDWIEERLRDGASTREIAGALGVTTANIHMRMRTRGTTVEAIRRAVTA